VALQQRSIEALKERRKERRKEGEGKEDGRLGLHLHMVILL
jgi:hypothetical protein